MEAVETKKQLEQKTDHAKENRSESSQAKTLDRSQHFSLFQLSTLNMEHTSPTSEFVSVLVMYPFATLA